MLRTRLLAALALALAAPRAATAQELSVWLQVDYAHGQESVDQLNDADGKPLNQDRVVIPRSRLKLSEGWSYLELAAEADFGTAHGPAVGVRQLEAALVWPPHPARPLPDFRFATARPARPATPTAPAATDAGAAPEAAPSGASDTAATAALPAARPLLERHPLQLRFGGGVFRAPFGHDVSEVSFTDRVFAQPSLLSQAFFPGEFDLGARLSARWRGIGLVLAMQNGEPLGTKAFPGADPNAAKDWLARLTVSAEPTPWLALDVGGSGLYGTGFHPGTPATKDVLVWRDLNEDGIVQLAELQAIRGSAATPSQNFPRWGVAMDLRARFRLPFGDLTLFGEAALAQDLDRGLRPADPVLLGRPQRSVAAFAGFTQDILGRLLVGFRADHYLAELDQARYEGGTLVRAREPFTHFSFALAYCFGSSLPVGKGRLVADYTLRLDPLGRDQAGRPADLQNDLFTLRLQLEL